MVTCAYPGWELFITYQDERQIANALIENCQDAIQGSRWITAHSAVTIHSSFQRHWSG
jgi:hypothetical protein